MKIAVLVKFVPNVDDFKYDYEKNVIIRENSHMLVNPDDTAALAYAIQLRDTYKDAGAQIEVISMAPLTLLPLVRDILRIHVDQYILLADQAFAGSDTLATSIALSRVFQPNQYDVILSGSHSLDGGTAHVPAQLAELLKIEQIFGIVKILEINLSQQYAVVQVEDGNRLYTYKVALPAILSVTKQSGYKMPFIAYEDMDLDVDDRFQILTSFDLGLSKKEIGLKGSKTLVKSAYAANGNKAETIFVQVDDAGVDVVYHFLKNHNYI